MRSSEFADVSGDLDLELNWFTSAGTGSADGGGRRPSQRTRRFGDDHA